MSKLSNKHTEWAGVVALIALLVFAFFLIYLAHNAWHF
jgi:hypothetical protein